MCIPKHKCIKSLNPLGSCLIHFHKQTETFSTTVTALIHLCVLYIGIHAGLNKTVSHDLHEPGCSVIVCLSACVRKHGTCVSFFFFHIITKPGLTEMCSSVVGH